MGRQRQNLLNFLLSPHFLNIFGVIMNEADSSQASIRCGERAAFYIHFVQSELVPAGDPPFGHPPVGHFRFGVISACYQTATA